MAVVFLDPDSTVTQAGNWVSTPASQPPWSVLDDAVRQPTAPSTASDYMSSGDLGPGNLDGGWDIGAGTIRRHIHGGHGYCGRGGLDGVAGWHDRRRRDFEYHRQL